MATLTWRKEMAEKIPFLELTLTSCSAFLWGWAIYLHHLDPLRLVIPDMYTYFLLKTSPTFSTILVVFFWIGVGLVAVILTWEFFVAIQMLRNVRRIVTDMDADREFVNWAYWLKLCSFVLLLEVIINLLLGTNCLIMVGIMGTRAGLIFGVFSFMEELQAFPIMNQGEGEKFLLKALKADKGEIELEENKGIV